MFRAIGVTTFRRNGFSEGKVALWSSLIFGLAHIANVIGSVPSAFAEAIIVSFAGYFFYLIRRVSRSTILNSVLHGLFDFTLITGTQIMPESEDAYPASLAGIAVYVVCGIIVLIRRHRIELPTPLPQPAALVCIVRRTGGVEDGGDIRASMHAFGVGSLSFGRATMASAVSIDRASL